MSGISNARQHQDLLKGAMDHKYIGPILRHWLSLYESGEIPLYQQLDPTQFPLSLPYTSIFDWDASHHDFRCRLAGEDVAASHDSRLKGHLLEELYSAHRVDAIRDHWLRVINEKKILFALLSLPQKSNDLQSRRIILPLYDEKKDCPAIISISYYDYDAGYYYREYHNPANPGDFTYVYMTAMDINRVAVSAE